MLERPRDLKNMNDKSTIFVPKLNHNKKFILNNKGYMIKNDSYLIHPIDNHLTGKTLLILLNSYLSNFILTYRHFIKGNSLRINKTSLSSLLVPNKITNKGLLNKVIHKMFYSPSASQKYINNLVNQ